MEGLREGFGGHQYGLFPDGDYNMGGRLRTWSAYAYILKHHNEGWAKNGPS